MKYYTAWEWLLIDLANQYGLDKYTFEYRINWGNTVIQNGGCFENLILHAENRPLYKKACMAIRKAMTGKPTGHMVGVDACCSGIQIMSAITGCIAGSKATGLIDPDVRADAYEEVTNAMGAILETNVNVTRQQAKEAIVPCFYGSKLKPKEIFGEDTPELNAFYQAAYQVAPGAWELLQDLLASWQPYALQHDWKMPDGFDVRIKVMQKQSARIEVDELDHATFTYEYYDNVGSKNGLSNAANVVHSIDGFIVREMHRRCNYDKKLLSFCAQVLEIEVLSRLIDQKITYIGDCDKAIYYSDQYERSGVVTAAILPYIDICSVQVLSDKHLRELVKLVNNITVYKPFELVTIHDEFKSHANHVNTMRYHYKEILADLADSNVLEDLLSQIHKHPGRFNKLSSNLGDTIRESNYALT